MAWFAQQDPQWSNIRLGYGPATIGQAGCYLTTYANIAHFCAGGNTTVVGLNGFFMSIGRWVAGDELTDQALDGEFGCVYKETHSTPGPLTEADYNYLQDARSEQYAVEIWINGNSNRTHFVLWYDGHTADDFRIVDSWDGQVKYLKTAYGDPTTIIQKFVHYQIPALLAPATPPAPQTPDTATPSQPVSEPVAAPTPAAPSPQPISAQTNPKPAPQDPPVQPAPATKSSVTPINAPSLAHLNWFQRLVVWLDAHLWWPFKH